MCVYIGLKLTEGDGQCILSSFNYFSYDNSIVLLIARSGNFSKPSSRIRKTLSRNVCTLPYTVCIRTQASNQLQCDHDEQYEKKNTHLCFENDLYIGFLDSGL